MEPLDNDGREGSSSSPIPEPWDSSKLISSSSPNDDDDELPLSESPASDSTTDARRFLFPFLALGGGALRGAVFFDFDVRSPFAFLFRKAEERGSLSTGSIVVDMASLVIVGIVSTDRGGRGRSFD